MTRQDWQPRPAEDDPYNVRGRGERSEATVREDYDEVWGSLSDDDAGEWELGQMNWLRDMEA